MNYFKIIIYYVFIYYFAPDHKKFAYSTLYMLDIVYKIYFIYAIVIVMNV